MATSTKIVLSTADTGVVKIRPLTVEAAKRTSELLQKNHDDFHIFFNSSGFHNHVAHGLLTLYALGASVDALENHFKVNSSYQLPLRPASPRNVVDMNDQLAFKKFLGKGVRYPDFLTFFQQKLDADGVETVLQEYLFGKNEIANDMLRRLFAGVYHPLIHLGFGLEFNQPAIIAEALAMTAVHRSEEVASVLAKLESANQTGSTDKSLTAILTEMQVDDQLRSAVRYSDNDKLSDGLMARAPKEIIQYAAQWNVTPEELQRKTAEMINSAMYFTMSAQRPPKDVKMDFFLLHCVTTSIFWGTLNRLPWLPDETKVKLLKWKGWLDLIEYAKRGMPKLSDEEVVNYKPKMGGANAEWDGLVERLCHFEHDDGHAVKLLRAVAYGAEVTKKFEGEEWAKFKDDTFRIQGNMIADSVETPGPTWVRSCGFEEAWSDVENRTPVARM